jgi:hypothetical protein
MRKTILLFLLFTHVFVSAQQGRISVDSIANLLSGKMRCWTFSQPVKEYDLKLRGNSMSNKEAPFYVVDGIPADETEIRKIDPDNIISIDILRTSDFVLGCGPANGPIIIIVTKNTDQRTIIIRDAETGKPIPAASVELMSSETNREKISFIADSAGRVIINKIESGIAYELTISSVGYKNFVSIVNTMVLQPSHAIFLEKDHRVLTEVIVVSHGRRTIGCCVGIRCCKIYKEEKTKIDSREEAIPIRVYPNPVLRSHDIKLEFKVNDEQKFAIKLFSLDGRLVSSREYRLISGINRLSFPVSASIAAGVYSIQLIGQSGRLIKTEKLIIQ